MAVKPYDWVSWSAARSRMPEEIWSGWKWNPAGADRAMVNSLRRGKVPFRGTAEHREGIEIMRSVPLNDVVAGLLSLSLSAYFSSSAAYEHKELNSPALSLPLQPPLRMETRRRTVELVGPELAWDEFRDDLIRNELPAGATPNPEPAAVSNDPRRRAAYKGPLAEWMARKGYKLLHRMTPAAIAADFKEYCEKERSGLLPRLPQRSRSMEGTIERIRKRMAAARESE